MKHGLVWVLMVFLFIGLGACGSKQSAVEGKLVDWNGKPMVGVKITAAQIDPIKGYEQFEAITKSDGTFRIKGLFPSSEYVLKPWSDKWTCNTVVYVESAPQGETALLRSPMVIRQVFTRSKTVLPADIATGAAAQSVVEGKLLDWDGKPLSGVKITATQLRPVEGYEEFETVTASDGSFRLPSLLASSRYVLKPSSDKWSTETSVSVDSPSHHGEIAFLRSPMVITRAYCKSSGTSVLDLATGKTRFTVSSHGVITDHETNLEWVVWPNQHTNYSQAEQWVAANKVEGGGWRMPTRQELRTLYQKGVGHRNNRNMDPIFKITRPRVEFWAEPRDLEAGYSSSVWTFRFLDGVELYAHPQRQLQVLGVRSLPRR